MIPVNRLRHLVYDRRSSSDCRKQFTKSDVSRRKFPRALSSARDVIRTAIVRRVVLIGAFAILASAVQFSQTKPVAAPKSSPTKSSGSGVILSSTDGKRIIQQARRSYYSLTAAGLIEFQCDVLPDWDFIYKQSPAGQELLPILKKTHFQGVVGPSGASTISHQSDVAPSSEAAAASVHTAVSGVESLLTGFFAVWSQYAFTPPLPEVDDKYQLEDLGERYRLTYRQRGLIDVLTLMNRDFAIEEDYVRAPQFSLRMRPKFASTKSGFEFVGYESSEQVGENMFLQSSVNIEYQEVEALQLPRTVNATIGQAPSPMTVRLSFTNYKVKKR